MNEDLKCPYYKVSKQYKVMIDELNVHGLNSGNCPTCKGENLECLIYNDFLQVKGTKIKRNEM